MGMFAVIYDPADQSVTPVGDQQLLMVDDSDLDPASPADLDRLRADPAKYTLAFEDLSVLAEKVGF